MTKQDGMGLPAVTPPITSLGAHQAELGESPVWSDQHQRLWWVDIEGRKLLATALDGDTQIWDAP